MPHPPFIALDDESDMPLYRKIYEAIRTSILTGEFHSGRQLPASRELARKLEVSRMTVINAYDQLIAEGYIEGRVGSGTFVASRLPDEFLQVTEPPRKTNSRLSNRLSRPSLSSYGRAIARSQAEILAYNRATRAVPFQYGLAAIDRFPFDIWTKLTNKSYSTLKRDAFGYGDAAGYLPLREAVAAYLKSFRAVNCTPEEIIITNGAQHAFDIIGRVFLERDSRVWVENPCYISAKQVFMSLGARLKGVPVDREGMSLARAPKSERSPALVYITPSHQFPLGGVMSLSRRLQLLEWAHKGGTYIIEDDYDSEFRYESRPIPSLQGLDRNGRVLYVGTFNKIVFPSLRLGCIVAPPELAKTLAAVRTLSGSHAPLIEQATLAYFLNEGYFTRHLRRMRRLYEHRQKVLIHELQRHLSGKLEITETGSGMHVVGWLPNGIDDNRVVKRAADEGLKLVSVSSHSLTSWKRGGLVLGYTALNEEQIRYGVEKLARVLREFS